MSSSETALPTAPRLWMPDGSTVRAVVVDDEESLADLLTMALRYEGWEVCSAGTGQAAIALVREFRADVVVLDIMLPDIDGLDVLKRIRADGHDTPVLFLTTKDGLRLARASRSLYEAKDRRLLACRKSGRQSKFAPRARPAQVCEVRSPGFQLRALAPELF